MNDHPVATATRQNSAYRHRNYEGRFRKRRRPSIFAVQNISFPRGSHGASGFVDRQNHPARLQFQRHDPERNALSGVIDSSSFADYGMDGGGRADVMNKLGCRWRPALKGPGSRLTGIAHVHQRLALKKDGYGGLVVFRNCRNLVRTLPAVVYSRTNPEDIDDSCEQHPVDALRYGLTRKRHWFVDMRVMGI
jgi:hypothetical protein